MAAPEDISENETLPLPIGNKQCGREHKKINKKKITIQKCAKALSTILHG